MISINTNTTLIILFILTFKIHSTQSSLLDQPIISLGTSSSSRIPPKHIPDHYVPPENEIPLNENYNQYKCPIKPCDPGIVCRNMFGNVQCVSQYDAFLLISFKKDIDWRGHGGQNYCKYDGSISNLNSIATTTFSVKVNWMDRLVNTSYWGLEINEKDDPQQQLLHMPKGYVLDQVPHSFGFIIKCPEDRWVPRMIFNSVEFTTIPPVPSLTSSVLLTELEIGDLKFDNDIDYNEDFQQQGGLVY